MDEKEHLPDEFSSLEEIQDFWDRRSSTAYDDEMEPVEMELSGPLRTKIESRKLYKLLGLSPREVAKIEAVAEKERMGIRELIARWVLEHLNEPSVA